MKENITSQVDFDYIINYKYLWGYTQTDTNIYRNLVSFLELNVREEK